MAEGTKRDSKFDRKRSSTVDLSTKKSIAKSSKFFIPGEVSRNQMLKGRLEIPNGNRTRSPESLENILIKKGGEAVK